jgi:hypothetical protein
MQKTRDYFVNKLSYWYRILIFKHLIFQLRSNLMKLAFKTFDLCPSSRILDARWVHEQALQNFQLDTITKFLCSHEHLYSFTPSQNSVHDSQQSTAELWNAVSCFQNLWKKITEEPDISNYNIVIVSASHRTLLTLLSHLCDSGVVIWNEDSPV